jgi:DNA-binding CsgD family transcriptional regulator
MSSDDDSVLASIEAGAAGYVLKEAGRVDIVRALMDLHSGGSPISPLIARKVLSHMRDAIPAASDLTADDAGPVMLTPRETTILDLIARGDSYGGVARTLSVSVGTVQTHAKNIYAKLAVHSRGEAVFEAQRRGLLRMGAFKAPRLPAHALARDIVPAQRIANFAQQHNVFRRRRCGRRIIDRLLTAERQRFRLVDQPDHLENDEGKYKEIKQDCDEVAVGEHSAGLLCFHQGQVHCLVVQRKIVV